MHLRKTIKHVKGRDLGSVLRRRLRLAPDEEIEVTVTKRPAATKRIAKSDPWKAIKGILSPEEADELIRAIRGSRRSKLEAPDVDLP